MGQRDRRMKTAQSSAGAQLQRGKRRISGFSPLSFPSWSQRPILAASSARSRRIASTIARSARARSVSPRRRLATSCARALLKRSGAATPPGDAAPFPSAPLPQNRSQIHAHACARRNFNAIIRIEPGQILQRSCAPVARPLARRDLSKPRGAAPPSSAVFAAIAGRLWPRGHKERRERYSSIGSVACWKSRRWNGEPAGI